MNEYTTLATDEQIQTTIAALKENGMQGMVVENAQKAKEALLSLIPKGAQVFTMTSVTLDSTGIAKEINESGNYDAVRTKLNTLNRETDAKLMQQMGAAPDIAVGSVHAVTQDGKVLIASNTGSQLPAYVYGAKKVIWVVGAQKITKNLDEATKRVYDHVLPLESERAHKAYGVEGSNVSKLLLINKETHPERITVIFVKEALGF